MEEGKFIPHHMSITEDDLAGNKGIGRYVILPGSDGRAKEISKLFNNPKVKKHPRCHNFYMGNIETENGDIDVAVIASGMGSPSVDIIVNELYKLGARRILRIGTSGSLQPDYIRTGATVVATGAVRDESTSSCYMPREIPALASIQFVNASARAAEKLKMNNVFFGLVHTKDSLYAREFGEGPMKEENRRYMQLLRASGVLASEMECSLLFTLGNVFNTQLLRETVKGKLSINQFGSSSSKERFLVGAILAVVGDDSAFSNPEQIAKAEERAITLGIETIKEMAKIDMGF